MNETVATRDHVGTERTSTRKTIGGRGLTWRRLQMIAAAVAVLTFLVPMVVGGKVEGFLAAMAAPFILGLVLTRFLPRTGAVFLGVVSVAILLSSAPFLVEALRHPESAVDFIPLTFLVIATVVGAASAVPAFRQVRSTSGGSGAARRVAVAAAALGLTATVFSVVAAAGVKDVAVQPGDTTIVTSDFVFAPARIEAKSGSVSVHVTNDDATRHTFTIDGLADVSVPPNSAQRLTFDADPGTYRFYCEPHTPGMEGTLVVE